LGADVIKIERPGGDPFRSFAGGTYSPHFQAHNRNKRSAVIDYAKPEGLAQLRELAGTANVLVINTRPGVAESIGLDDATLREINPRLVYCSITGFGANGPYADRPAFDNVGQGISGWSSRYRSGSDPRVVGPAVSDAATGMYAALGIVAALLEQKSSGQGHRVDISMVEATIAFCAEPLGQFLATGKTPPVHQRAAMSQSYNVTCADGKRICLHLSSPDKFWLGLCRAIGRPLLADEFPRRIDRVKAYDKIALILNEAFGERPRSAWLELLEGEDVPFAPEYELSDLEADPQIQHLEVFYELKHPVHGSVRAPHRPIRVDGTRTIDFRPPPELGEHTAEVLAEMAHWKPDESAVLGRGVGIRVQENQENGVQEHAGQYNKEG
jgi:crotonobetainyl-CoA:carnitine CoA-transferase CaiB-like acyl-CoA transferase